MSEAVAQGIDFDARTAALKRASAMMLSDPAEAERQARALLAATPNDPGAILIVAAARRRQGDPVGAHALLAPLALARPDAFSVQQELGEALAALGRTDEAIAVFRRALCMKPDAPQVWRLLGDQLTLAKDALGADEAYGRYIAAPTTHPALSRVATAIREGAPAEAERLVRGHLARFPNDVVALWMLADVLTRANRFDEAAPLLARCLGLAPSYTAARLSYAFVLFNQQKATEAAEQLERLLAREPGNLLYRKMLAGTLDMMGESSRSIELFNLVLGEDPGDAPLWVSYGNALKAAGRREDAIAAYRRAIALAPDSGRGYWSLANLKTVRFTLDEEVAMIGHLQRTDLSATNRLMLHNALGKALEDRGEYAASFHHYAMCAKVQRADIRYDADEMTAHTRRARALFTPEFFTARAGGGSNSTAPIFIVGLPRSGSTLVEQILASHSAVEGTMELADIMKLAVRLSKGGGPGEHDLYPESLSDLTPRERMDLGEEYVARASVHRRLGRPFFIDKMPNNFQHIGLIELILPNTKIIDVRRNPMATGFSAFKQYFPRGQVFSYDLTELGRYYRDYVELMGHFDRVLPDRIHRIVYEDLIENPEIEVRRALEYCGLRFEPACLNFHETSRVVRTASSEQVRQPINGDGLDQWRHFEPWLDTLRDALGPALDGWRTP
jgi:predicted Zn-dependent protease